ncbi:hypothetical protein ACSL103130_00305 [Actinomyces slackii]|uniref:Uncharacterized protein n=1 Tax=Actinomyces slackii TaxID=52774 RepID=A0A448KFA2_9ACTO|nr:hypothetical protein [Actinomyces slackii]VEG75589.1 Uncharacterised protein [Actinomyces slackii]
MQASIGALRKGTERQNNIEVWNDLVSPRDLLICLAVSVISVGTAVLISLMIGGSTLLWGLGASVLGFALNCFLVTPKRDVRIVDEMDRVEDEGSAAGGDAR